MLYSRKQNVRIPRLHERALRIVYRDFDSSFEKLLGRDSSAILHQRNLQKLMTEIFKLCSLSHSLNKYVTTVLYSKTDTFQSSSLPYSNLER